MFALGINLWNCGTAGQPGRTTLSVNGATGFVYRRPGGADTYRRTDATSTYKRPTVIGIGGDNPANAAEPNATAWVLMDGPWYNTAGNASSGFVGGQSWRKMSPIGYAPYGNETYVYGDEVVRYETGVWLYLNGGLGEIARAYSYAAYPWLATNWSNGFTAAKITSTYVKTTNYPTVP